MNLLPSGRDLFDLGKALAKLCAKYKKAPGHFQDLSKEVELLKNILDQIREQIQKDDLPPHAARQTALAIALQNTKPLLGELSSLLAKHEEWIADRMRFYDRLKFVTNDNDEMKEKVHLCTRQLEVSLSALNCLSLRRVEQKLDEVLHEYSTGRRPRSVVSAALTGDKRVDQAELTRQIYNDLEDKNVHPDAIALNEDRILSRLRLDGVTEHDVLSIDSGNSRRTARTYSVPSSNLFTHEGPSNTFVDNMRLMNRHGRRANSNQSGPPDSAVRGSRLTLDHAHDTPSDLRSEFRRATASIPPNLEIEFPGSLDFEFPSNTESGSRHWPASQRSTVQTPLELDPIDGRTNSVSVRSFPDSGLKLVGSSTSNVSPPCESFDSQNHDRLDMDSVYHLLDGLFSQVEPDDSLIHEEVEHMVIAAFNKRDYHNRGFLSRAQTTSLFLGLLRRADPTKGETALKELVKPMVRSNATELDKVDETAFVRITSCLLEHVARQVRSDTKKRFLDVRDQVKSQTKRRQSTHLPWGWHKSSGPESEIPTFRTLQTIDMKRRTNAAFNQSSYTAIASEAARDLEILESFESSLESGIERNVASPYVTTLTRMQELLSEFLLFEVPSRDDTRQHSDLDAISMTFALVSTPAFDAQVEDHTQLQSDHDLVQKLNLARIRSNELFASIRVFAACIERVRPGEDEVLSSDRLRQEWNRLRIPGFATLIENEMKDWQGIKNTINDCRQANLLGRLERSAIAIAQLYWRSIRTRSVHRVEYHNALSDRSAKVHMRLKRLDNGIEYISPSASTLSASMSWVNVSNSDEMFKTALLPESAFEIGILRIIKKNKQEFEIIKKKKVEWKHAREETTTAGPTKMVMRNGNSRSQHSFKLVLDHEPLSADFATPQEAARFDWMQIFDEDMVKSSEQGLAARGILDMPQKVRQVDFDTTSTASDRDRRISVASLFRRESTSEVDEFLAGSRSGSSRPRAFQCLI